MRGDGVVAGLVLVVLLVAVAMLPGRGEVEVEEAAEEGLLLLLVAPLASRSAEEDIVNTTNRLSEASVKGVYNRLSKAVVISCVVDV